jgi:hypothetical protein
MIINLSNVIQKAESFNASREDLPCMRLLASSSFFFWLSALSFLGSYEYVEDESRNSRVAGLVDMLEDEEEEVVDVCEGIVFGLLSVNCLECNSK